jgi:hypothetical protein
MTAISNSVIMREMKHFILKFVMIMFLANTLTVSAWGAVVVNMDAGASMSTQSMDMAEMPCHDEAAAKQKEAPVTSKHCDGLCLCLHVSLSQTPLLNSEIALHPPISGAKPLFDKVGDIASLEITPLRRPPKYNP